MTFHRQITKTNSSRRGGHSVIEIALMLPWILLLFLAIFDFGFYAYAAMATANAARAAALRTASSTATATDQSLACVFARREMRMLYNIPSGTNCTTLPLIVTTPASPNESRVSVTYQTPQLFPLPWLMGRMTLTRVSIMRIYR